MIHDNTETCAIHWYVDKSGKQAWQQMEVMLRSEDSFVEKLQACVKYRHLKSPHAGGHAAHDYSPDEDQNNNRWPRTILQRDTSSAQACGP